MSDVSPNVSPRWRSQGHPESLRGLAPGNTSRLTHGLYSSGGPRGQAELESRGPAGDAARDPAGLPGRGGDRPAAKPDQRIDRALTDGRVETPAGEARKLIDFRRKLSGELRTWLQDFGMTPKSRADFAQAMSGRAGGSAAPDQGGAGRVTSDLRPVLEAVIFAEDVTPGERLKAIEQLRQLDGEHICPRCAVFDPPPDPDGFWEHTDDLLSSLVPFLDAHGQARMPLTARRMLEIVEREAVVRARVISDASRIEPRSNAGRGQGEGVVRGPVVPARLFVRELRASSSRIVRPGRGW